jgi:phosphoribosylformimino-5-aminoimidazole carboxamide ribotide isomerase
MASVREVFDAGADIVSIGSAALLKLLVEACREFPGRVFDFDVREGRIAIKPWVETTELGVADALQGLRRAGVAAVTLTDIARDGTETGANVSMFSKFLNQRESRSSCRVSVATLEDLRSLKTLFAKQIVGELQAPPSMRAD